MYVGKKRVEKEKKEMGGDLAGWRLKSRVPRSRTLQNSEPIFHPSVKKRRRCVFPYIREKRVRNDNNSGDLSLPPFSRTEPKKAP